jgi:CRISPR-associated protein Cas8a1/Csx13
MAITTPQKLQTQTKLEYHLGDLGFTSLHRAGMAGLYMSLKQIQNFSEKPEGLAWELTPNSIKLDWSCSDKEALEWILKSSFQIDDEGLIDFPALKPCNLKLNDGSKLVIHEGILGTFLQHGQTRKLGEKKTQIFSIEDKEIIKEFKPIKPGYSHQEAISKLGLCDNKGTLNQNLLGVAGWLYPGAAVRHNAYSNDTKIEESAANCFILLFAPIACHYFQIKSTLKDKRAQYCLIIPEIFDSEDCANLEDYAKRRWQMTIIKWSEAFASSGGDAVLILAIHSKIEDVLYHLQTIHYQINVLGTLGWSSQQKSRTQIISATVSKNPYQAYEVIHKNLHNRIKTTDKGQSWVDVGFARELFSENIVKNQPWYKNFSSLVNSKERFNKLGYEKEGLNMVIQEIQWDQELEKQFVIVCHEAIRRRYAQLGQRASGEGLSFSSLIQRENEKLRSSIQRCKNAQTMREFLTDFWSRSGPLPTLKDHWQDIWQLMDEQKWRVAKDLALLALASYKGKENSVIENTQETEMEA